MFSSSLCSWWNCWGVLCRARDWDDDPFVDRRFYDSMISLRRATEGCLEKAHSFRYKVRVMLEVYWKLIEF